VLQAAPTFGSDGSLRVGIVHGAESGPVLAVVAGVHGSEYAGIEAATRLYRDVEAQRLRGTIIVVPTANPAAFAARVFPGDGGKTVSYRIARTLMREVALRCDALVDLHGADLGEAMVPCVTALDHGQGEGDEATLAMASVYGTEFVRTRPASSARGTFGGEVRALGTPAIMCELGAGGSFEEADIDAHCRGLRNVLRSLAMLEGAQEPGPPQRVAIGEELIVAEQGGVFHPRVQPRAEVRTGDVVADVTDEWGTVLERHHAVHDGVVRLIFLRRVVQPGNPLLATMLFA